MFSFFCYTIIVFAAGAVVGSYNPFTVKAEFAKVKESVEALLAHLKK